MFFLSRFVNNLFLFATFSVELLTALALCLVVFILLCGSPFLISSMCFLMSHHVVPTSFTFKYMFCCFSHLAIELYVLPFYCTDCRPEGSNMMT